MTQFEPEDHCPTCGAPHDDPASLFGEHIANLLAVGNPRSQALIDRVFGQDTDYNTNPEGESR